MAPTALAPLAGGTRVDGFRADGFGGRWTNERTGQGMGPSRTPWTDFQPPTPLPRSTVDALLRFNGLARRLALREPYDATREGFSLGPTPEAERLVREARRRKVLSWIRRGRGWARAYGGAAIVLLVDDGRTPDQPIDYANLRAVRGARVLTRWEISPLRYDWRASSYNIGDVQLWQVNIGHASLHVHPDRVVVMQGADLPDDVMMQDNGWGASVFDQAWAELRNYGSSLDYLPEFVSLLTQAVFKQKGLASGVLAGKAQQIADRYSTLVGGMSVLNAIAIDAEHEDYNVVQRPVSGMREIFDVLVQALVAAGDMPRVILLGETPGGLHAGADAPEIRAWYDDVSAKQEEFYSEPLERILHLLARSSEGPTGGRPIPLQTEWLPLYQQTEQEAAQLDMTRAQRRSVDLAAGVVSAAEARRDPDLARLYDIDPDDPLELASPAQAEPGSEDLMSDEDELQPVVAADTSLIPDGESLISPLECARRLGFRSAGPVQRMAAAGKFPAFRVNSRWRYAWSLVQKGVAHSFDDPTAVH